MGVLKSPRRERFAQELAKGRTQVEAYKSAGYAANEGNASKLADKPEVAGRVKELTGKAAAKVEITIASIAAELDEARALAMRIDLPAPAVAASMGKAKLAGLLSENIKLSGDINVLVSADDAKL